MPRQDTRLESEGAEFLVLGNLLLHGIAAYKAYTNMAGYDVVAVSPDQNSSARIQVKSRWETGAGGFPIKNFECDFIVVALLNRGSKTKKKEIKPPQFFVLPVQVAKNVLRTGTWSKIVFRDIPEFKDYESRWDLVEQFLGLSHSNSPQEKPLPSHI